MAQVRGPEDQLIVREASGLVEELLGASGERLHHSAAVAARAATAAVTVAPEHRPVLVAAAWLHDIGYAEPLRRSTFHPLDGALHLQDAGWSPLLVGLVAHHSGARFVAAERGLSAELARFSDVAFTTGALADALTYADQTTGPDGQAMDVEDRLADMIARHGPDSPNARCHAERAPVLRAAVRRTTGRLHAARGD